MTGHDEGTGPSFDRLCELLAALGIGVYGMQYDRLVVANDPVCAMTGRSRVELLTIDPLEFLSGVDRAEIVHRREPGAASPAIFEYTISATDGSLTPVRVAEFSQVRSGFSLGVAIDRTDEIAHIRRREMLTRLLEEADVAFAIWDATGAITGHDLRLHSLNRLGEEHLGVSFADVEHRRLGELMPWVPRELAERALAVAGTDHRDVIGDGVIEVPGRPDRLFRRTAIGLPGNLVAIRARDITAEREEQERRETLLRRIIDLGDTERRQLAMDMHDDAIQQVAAAALLVEGVARRADDAELRDRLDLAGRAVRRAAVELRQLAFSLSPPELLESGLESAVKNAAEYIFDGRDAAADVDVEFEIDTDRLTDDAVQTAAFRLVVEALTNVRKHASASSVVVEIVAGEDAVVLRVCDDGVGIPDDAAGGHFGLRNMYERAAALGGVCTVARRAATRGTEMVARLPLRADNKMLKPIPVTLDRQAIEAVERERDSASAAAARQRARAEHGLVRLGSITTLACSLAAQEPTAASIGAAVAECVDTALGDGAVLCLLSDDGAQLTPVAVWARDTELRAGLEGVFASQAADLGHAGMALRSRKPVALDLDRLPYDRGSGVPPAVPDVLRWLVVVPLIVGGGVIGTLCVARSRRGTDFGRDEAGLVEGIASIVATAVGRMRH